MVGCWQKSHSEPSKLHIQSCGKDEELGELGNNITAMEKGVVCTELSEAPAKFIFAKIIRKHVLGR